MLTAAIVSSLDSDLSATVQKNPFPYICLSKDRMDAIADTSQDDRRAKVASLGHKEARREIDYDKTYNSRTQEKGRDENINLC